MLNVLVTGAHGFIGRALVISLKRAGHRVIEMTRLHGDIADPKSLKNFEDLESDFVFHLAARSYVPDSWNDPIGFHRVNVEGTLNVLEYCRRRKTPLTYLSAYLYGIPGSLPIKESDKPAPNNPYALSKFQAEILCQFYQENFEIPITIVRPFNIYGNGQKTCFLVAQIIDQVLSGKSIRVNDLTPRRDYLYLDDLVDGLLRTLGIVPGCRTFNMGSGYSVSVAEIINIIQNIAGTKQEVYCQSRPRENEIPDLYADIQKAGLELGWRPTISFTDGVKQILNYSSR